MPSYCLYVISMGSIKHDIKRKKIIWAYGRKWEIGSKTSILSKHYNQHISEFGRLHCGGKDGWVLGDVQVPELSD